MSADQPSSPLDDVINKLGLLRRELHELEVDTDFQEVYLEIPQEKRNSRTFRHVVYQDLLHAYYYACRGGKAAHIDAEICRMLLAEQDDKTITADDARKHIVREFYRFENHEPSDHTPAFLTLFNNDQDTVYFVGLSLIEVKKRWDDLALALVQAAPNQAVRDRMSSYLELSQYALQRFRDAEPPEEDDTPSIPSTSTDIIVAPEKPAPERFKNAAINTLFKTAQSAGIPDDVMKELERDLTTLDSMSPTSQDYNNRLQPVVTLINLPWNKRAAGQDNINDAHARMHEKHAGLDKIKKIIVEHIAVQMRTGKPSGSILCLDGAPGVGKTSMAQTIAYAMGRPLVRIPLGGMYDTAHMVGHSSTYIGAKAGRIINGLLQAGVKNPVILLDEIDKVDHARGNLEGTLLAILDPEQNVHFRDIFVNAPFDLSEVVFIATSNDKSQILPALRDRMEIINLPNYTAAQKYEIAQNHLLPKNMKAYDLTGSHFNMAPAAIKRVISDYTQEPGVRNLERQLKSIMRKAVYTLESGAQQSIQVSENDLPDYLEKPRTYQSTLTDEDAVGVVNGLYVAGSSGGLLPFEVIKIPSSRKELSIGGTGLMQQSMRETLIIVTKWLRSQANKDLLKDAKVDDFELHVDAILDGPKDGPSAGIAITAACVSTLLDKPLRHDIAMTGKMTMGGRVRAVGGILEKLDGAMKNGMKVVLIPKHNEKDLKDVSAEITSKVTIIPVAHIDDVLTHVFAKEAVKCLTWDEPPVNDNAAPAPVPAPAPAGTPAEDPPVPAQPVPRLPAPKIG